MKVKVISKSGSIPTYETESSAGADLRAFIKEPMILKPLKRMLVPTGLFVEIPQGYEGQVRARSGLALKYGITLINGIGTIDSDYRGEIMLPIINLGEEEYVINNGDRIGQLVINKYEKAEFVLSTEINSTDRGIGGFGHTGVK